MRKTLPAVLLASALLAACGGKPDDKAPAAAASAGAGRVVAASGATAGKATGKEAAATLLLAPEDLHTLRASQLAQGPVITGTVQPERRADLRAEVAAVVLQVLKENGEAVRAGDLLVRLDDTSIRDSLTSAEEATRASSQAFDQAERQVQRLKTLQTQGMTSMQALEDAEIRRNNSQSDLVAAKARVVSARQTMQRTAVRAPFDGVVSDRKVSAGDTVQVGKELMKVIDPRSMRFEGLVSAERLQLLRVGQNVVFRVNGTTQADFRGRVRRIDPAANDTTRQVAVIVDFVDAAAAPRIAGLFAEGRIETGNVQALMVPEGALVRAGQEAAVWRLNSAAGSGSGTLSRVAVQIGERDGRSGEFPVLGGLNTGDRILRRPGGSLVDGQSVDIQPARSATAAATATATAPSAVAK